MPGFMDMVKTILGTSKDCHVWFNGRLAVVDDYTWNGVGHYTLIQEDGSQKIVAQVPQIREGPAIGEEVVIARDPQATDSFWKDMTVELLGKSVILSRWGENRFRAWVTLPGYNEEFMVPICMICKPGTLADPVFVAKRDGLAESFESRWEVI